MSEMIEIRENTERVILAAVSTGNIRETEDSLDELAELARTAGAVVVARVTQNLDRIQPGTYFGSGKIEEIKEIAAETDATGLICDDELSPAQLRNISDELDIKIMDRTMVILDIFAGRARTKEGQIQVELAQLRYRSTRLVGMRDLSRLGGGIGTRGPGEKKLETDRRVIRERIAALREELEDIEKHREVTRKKRDSGNALSVAIVGYTNAGKSTLLNRLTDAGILAEDKLFATLDPTTREYTLPDGESVLFTDTVGFIRKLPHHLIEAFQSTLEEAKYSDVILHVVDASNPQMDMQMHVVYDTLKKLGITDKIIITAFNKIDRDDADRSVRDINADYQVRISALTGEGMEDLLDILEEIIKSQRVYLERIFPYDEAGRIQKIRSEGQLIEEEYREDGIHVKAYVPTEIFGEMLK